MEGTITKVVREGRFFLVDKDYWCHFDRYSQEPKEGDLVDYERKILSDGKKNAVNVRFIKKGTALAQDYLDLLKGGYFDKSGSLKEEFIITYPQIFATQFSQMQNVNKGTQLRKYFDYCRNLEGRINVNSEFRSITSKLLELIPLTNYAANKGLISPAFRDFIELNITEAAKNKENFLDGFLPHFQSLLGYYNTK